MKKNRAYFFLLFSAMIFNTKICAQVSEKAVNDFLRDSAVSTGYAGISIYDTGTKTFLFNYNAEENFVPSSNVKLFTLYAGMKFLGDSIAGLRYYENDTAIQIFATGDPGFLRSDMASQPVFDFLRSSKKSIHIGDDDRFRDNRYGLGWSWDDYAEDFMAERSLFPIYGNCISFSAKKGRISAMPLAGVVDISPRTASQHFESSEPVATRNFYANDFTAYSGFPFDKATKIPFITSIQLSEKLLADTLHRRIINDNVIIANDSISVEKIVYSRPADSLFRAMMFNSDNFFAEQTLLMVSNEKLGYMNDEDIIDTLLKKDLADIPTKPRWVDGSGLSRYNLFSPKDFIYILTKLEEQFGLNRMERILPTGGQGTLTNYYGQDSGHIFAKTGSMSNNVSLSGYLVTKKGKTLVFSVMVNNFNGSGRAGRKAIERLIESIRQSD